AAGTGGSFGLSSESRRGSSSSGALGPTYHNYAVANDLVGMQVQGRILSRRPEGFLVGVQGLIALLPINKRRDQHEAVVRKLETFYITNVEFSSTGVPNVTLSATHELNRFPRPGLGNYDSRKRYDYKGRFSQGNDARSLYPSKNKNIPYSDKGLESTKNYFKRALNFNPPKK
ncbi:hypothetical protein AYI68_g3122, partial [Smittium mucronatum]